MFLGAKGALCLTPCGPNCKILNMKSIYIDDELHRQLKLRAAERGQPLQQIVEEYVRAGLDAAAREATDVSTAEVTAAAAGGGAVDFWAGEEEDRYLPTDGKALD